jgi:hypothetical protein
MQGLALLGRGHKKYKEEIDIFCNGAEKLISIKIIRNFIEALMIKKPSLSGCFLTERGCLTPVMFPVLSETTLIT